MSEYINIGRDIFSFDSAPAFAPYSKVVTWIDEETSIASGDDSGRTLEVDLHWATQEIVDAMLARVAGFVYRPFSASGAELDPAAELGDGVLVNGVYAPLAAIRTEFGHSCIADISAPADEEIDHEYHYVSPTRRNINRKNTQLRVLIKETADTIMLSVRATDDRVAKLEVALEEVNISVGGTSGDLTKLTVKVDGVTITDSSGTTYLNGRKLQTGSVEADAIAAGVITADKLNVTGSIMFSDLDAATQSLINSGVTESEAVTIITNQLVSSPNIAGGKFKDLAQENWIEMGAIGETTGYLNHFCSTYSETDPVLVMGYYSPGAAPNWVLAPFGSMALDYVQSENKMYAVGTWDFSQATVIGL